MARVRLSIVGKGYGKRPFSLFIVAILSLVVTACGGSEGEREPGRAGSDAPVAVGQVVQGLTTTPPEANCVAATHGDHEYWFCPNLQTWTGARALCEGEGLNLVRIQDAAENDFIRTQVPIGAWIGASDVAQEGTWRWSFGGSNFWLGNGFGAPLDGLFSKWDLFEPNDALGLQDCARVLPTGVWRDEGCAAFAPYVCESGVDECPGDPQKVEPGVCGCGTPDIDSDGDGVPDCEDDCPNDPEKLAPGDCGCADAPAPADTPCNDGLCAANSQCDGAGTCGDPNDCAPESGCTLKTFQTVPYWFCRDDKTWVDARARCQAVGMDLVHIESAAENEFIRTNIIEASYIGATDADAEGEWRWALTQEQFWQGDGISGAPVGDAYNKWAFGQPNAFFANGEDCAEINVVSGDWNTENCTSHPEAYVCERVGDTYVVDPAVVPDPISDRDEETGEIRPVGAVQDDEGLQSEFIANELVIETSNQATLDDFVGRYGISVVQTIEFDPDPEDDLEAIHAIRIDPTKMADPSTLSGNIKLLEPDIVPEIFRLSDDLALRLLATWAEARVAGFDVDINWVGHGGQNLDPQRVLDQTLADDAAGPGDGRDWTVAADTTWSPNAFDWVHFSGGGAQRIGVPGAWRLLAGFGLLEPTIKMGIVDGGFASGLNDYPDVEIKYLSGPAITNPNSPSPDPSGPWHGSECAMVAFGRADNGVGGAGTGYPVVETVFLASHGGGNLTLRKTVRSLRELRRQNVEITSISWEWVRRTRFGGARLNRVLGRVRRKGMIVFASAGNDNQNVDRTIRRLRRRVERGRHMPCEGQGVVCVGGLRHNSLLGHQLSNYGSEDVNIWAPWFTVVGSTPDRPSTHTFTATSAATPYVAGVAALIWAADRTQSRQNVIDRLLDTAFEPGGSPEKVTRIVQATSAVRDALVAGGQGPAIRILSPGEGDRIEYGSSLPTSWFLFDGAEALPELLQLRIDGSPIFAESPAVRSSTTIPRDLLSVGENTLTISGLFQSGEVVSDPVTFVREVPGALRILRPVDQLAIRRSDAAAGLRLLTDPPDPDVTWGIDASSMVFEGGDIASQPFPPLEEGEHHLGARLFDGTFTASDGIDFCILPDTAPRVTATIVGPTEVVVDPPSTTTVEWSALIHQSNGVTGATETFTGFSAMVVEDSEGNQIESDLGNSVTISFNEAGGTFRIRVLAIDDIDPSFRTNRKVVASDLLTFDVVLPPPE